MPEINPTGYAKSLSQGDYDKLPLIRELYDVIDDAGVPVPIKLAHHQRSVPTSDMSIPDGVILISAIEFDDLDEAETLFQSALSKQLDGLELYNFIVDNYQNMYEESLIGRIAFNILPGPVSVPELVEVPRICGAYIQREYRQLRVSPRGYQMLGNHFGVVQSDQEQTVYGARLWLSSLPRLGSVVAVDLNEASVLENILHTNPPTGEFWDGKVLIGTSHEAELDKMAGVPISRSESKRHVVLEFVPSC